MEMKIFKSQPNTDYKDSNFTDKERLASLEERVVNLTHHLRLMARGYVILFVAVVITFVINDHGNHDTIKRLNREEAHTKTVQIAGGPVAVCLLDALKAVQPLLIKFPPASEPLKSYIGLQSHRYTDVKCPEPYRGKS